MSASGGSGGMHIALLFILPASVALDPSSKAVPAAAPVALVTTYDAFVATEETPATVDLVQPAVLIDQRGGTRLEDCSALNPIA
ncbi:MAG: hypothetical protein ABIW33_04270 [Sphingomicrobium sp.]